MPNTDHQRRRLGSQSRASRSAPPQMTESRTGVLKGDPVFRIRRRPANVLVTAVVVGVGVVGIVATSASGAGGDAPAAITEAGTAPFLSFENGVFGSVPPTSSSRTTIRPEYRGPRAVRCSACSSPRPSPAARSSARSGSAATALTRTISSPRRDVVHHRVARLNRIREHAVVPRLVEGAKVGPSVLRAACPLRPSRMNGGDHDVDDRGRCPTRC